VEFLVLGLVRRKSEVTVTSFDDGGTTHVQVRVAAEDVARVVGENGRTAASLRSVVGAAGLKAGRRFVVEIVGEEFWGGIGVGWVQ